MENGSDNLGAEQAKRSVEPHPDIGLKGLPAAGARAVCRIKKPASRGLLTPIEGHTNGPVLNAKFGLARCV